MSTILGFIPTVLFILVVTFSKSHTVQHDKEEIMVARIHWGILIPSWFLSSLFLFSVGSIIEKM